MKQQTGSPAATAAIAKDSFRNATISYGKAIAPGCEFSYMRSTLPAMRDRLEKLVAAPAP